MGSGSRSNSVDMEGVEAEGSLLEKCLPHVFFLNKLPDAYDSSSQLNHRLIQLIRNGIDDAIKLFPENFPEISKTKLLFNNWTQFDGIMTKPLWEQVQERIVSLSGNMMALFIEAQNAGMFLCHDEKEPNRLVLGTFQSSAFSSSIMSAKGELLLDFPEKVVSIPKSSFLCSDQFAQALEELIYGSVLTSTMAQPTARKAGQSVQETRDVADPMFVTDYLTSLLCDEESKTQTDFPAGIRKKIRDDVILGDRVGMPFRRSGLWTTAKVTLQISLIRELGQEEGRIVYKCVMLLAMRNALADFYAGGSGNGTYNSTSTDVIVQMMRKIARRLAKLHKLALQSKLLKQLTTMDLLESIINETLEPINADLTSKWNEECLPPQLKQRHNLSRLENREKMLQQNCSTVLQEALHRTQIREEGLKNSRNGELPPLPSCPPRKSVDFPSLTSGLRNHELDLELWEVENWVENHVDRFRQPTFCSAIKSLILTYSRTAASHYRNDPLANSRLILMVLKCIKILDEIALQKFPLLKKHLSGIDQEIFKRLLLPRQSDMQASHALEKYFSKRDQESSNDPSLISESIPSASSFGVIFARTNRNMEELRIRILQETEQCIEEKKAEVIRVRAACNELRRQINILTCTYTYDSYRERNVHSSYCKKCSLESSLNQKLVSVTAFEKPLPEMTTKQHAVVFELLIPEEIAILRDMLYFFKRDVTSVHEYLTANIRDGGDWGTSHFVGGHRNSPIASCETNLNLGSTTKSSMKTHWHRNKSVDLDEDQFILNNGWNHVYHGSSVIQISSPPGKRFTFQITDAKSNYRGMQWAIDSTTHMSNEVLARQRECTQELSIPEFIEYGSLRSGCRLQYRNILISLVNGNLSLQEEEVLMLFCQTLWQAGDPTDAWVRDWHVDLPDANFCKELLDLIRQKVDFYQKKWSAPYTMCCLIIILGRILELGTGQNSVIAAELLRKCRAICRDWIKMLNKLIRKSYASPEDDKNSLKLKLVISALALTLTFHAGSTFINLVMTDSEDLVNWLHGISTLYNEVFWNFDGRKQVLGLTDTLVTLLRRTICIAVSLEERIAEVVVEGKNEALKKFSSQFKEFPSSWSRCEGLHRQIYRCLRALNSKQEGHVVYLDCLFGRYLVDGFPLGRLPESLVKSELYQRVFQKAEFAVQPSTVGGITIFNTTSKFKGCNYGFSEYKGVITIEEENEKGEFSELIQHQLFCNIFPVAFSETFSHWWNQARNVIYFRSKQFEMEDFGDVKYVLDLQTYRLKEPLTNRDLISITTKTYDTITQDLRKIEPLPHIHAWVSAEATVEVELVRLGLKFNWEEVSLDLVSREFPGMKVDPNQSLGTLVGLKNKLVLTDGANDVDETRKVIIPHGVFTITKDVSENHQTVLINLNSLRKPSFFTYELNNFLQRVQAGSNHSAWIYLAALHGATASPLPDKFLGMSGLEMAFEILQSARVWSCQPYDEESVATLKLISKMSPKRVFYPSHLKVQQKVAWPSGLPSICANEGYTILVEKLLYDSQNLGALFSSAPASGESSRQTGGLALRHYWRHHGLQNHSTYIKGMESRGLEGPRPTQYIRECLLPDRENVGINIRQLTALCDHGRSFVMPTEVKVVRGLLIAYQRLDGYSRSLADLRKLSFIGALANFINIRDFWIDLFRLAIDTKGFKGDFKHNWKLILSGLAFFEVSTQLISMPQIRILQAICNHFETFADVDVPTTPVYPNPASTFNYSEVQGLVSEYKKPFPSHRSFDTARERDKAESEHDREASAEVIDICRLIHNQWVPRVTRQIGISAYYSKIENLHSLQTQINQKIKMWYENSILDEFLEKFEAKLQQVTNSEKPLLPNISGNFSVHSIPTVDIPFGLKSVVAAYAKLENKTHLRALKNMIYVYTQSKADPNSAVDYEAMHFENKLGFRDCMAKLKTRSSDVWMKVISELDNFLFASQASISAGLFPRLVPSVILPLITWRSPKESSPTEKRNLERLQTLIGASCVYWTLEQKMARCIRFINAGDTMTVALQREKETEGLKSWCPKEFPEWLLLELELNMTIRPIQVKVAKAMLTPPSGSNSVMQLNMGEGKTALIVPMLISCLADGTNLCRVTVIKSIFETNINALRHTMGGLLNRRVYNIPCRRDLAGFDEGLVLKIQSSLQNCLNSKGVLVTLPEFRLSFQLKGYEMARCGQIELASKLIKCQNWLNENSRDILDESDDILSVKYQLIYTVGSQLPIGGGALRWELAQEIFRHLPKIMCELSEKFGNSEIEYMEQELGDASIFPECRILRLDSSCGTLLKEMVAETFMKGESIIGFDEIRDEQNKKLVKKFLIDNSITEAEVGTLLNQSFLKDSAIETEKLFILSGYLRFGVLEAALSKRWRVNYGVNQKGHRKMAVPFKAKDVASERTEFGHPDMAICLTLLSYYYSGLRDDQLEECMTYLKCNHMNPVNEYAKWIENVPETNVHPSVKSYDGLNLEDYEQRTQHLFPILRKSMTVLNFYLSTFVFPKESKQFEGKMTCTAWDLVSENKKLLTSGFSGTNDTKNLLPATISQNDLLELQDTNTKLERTLKEPQNLYEHFESGISSRGILRQLQKKGIRVLLDCGALMLQLNNEELAEEWLKIDPTLEAIVFFNNENRMIVKDRRLMKNCSFDISPYRENLKVCGVYLDDEHTRGTDIRFPQGARACVTLGSEQTRDKTVQACMRMRLLGRGHFVTFWASDEVHNKIISLSGTSNIGPTEVLQWVNANSEKFEKDGMVYWATSAVNYGRKNAAEYIFNGPNKNMEQLGHQCSENEVVLLEEMYGYARSQELFVNIAPRWFDAAFKEIARGQGQNNSSDTISIWGIKEIFERTKSRCVERLMKIIPKRTHFSQLLDEEQEKELEKEVEEETEKERPGNATPHPHQVTPELKTILMSGCFNSQLQGQGILPISAVFEYTNISNVLQPDCWGSNVYCTKDFKQTVKRFSTNETLTEFLRPVHWIVRVGAKAITIVISPFEANALISSFRHRLYKASLHLYSPRLLPTQNLLIDNPGLCLPSSSLFDVKISWGDFLPPLGLCAGSLYFENSDEEEAFAKFLALIPRPRSPQFQKWFEEGYLLEKNGFLYPKFRGLLVGSPVSVNSFKVDPESLVAGISRIRNQSQFPLSSHVGQLVVRGLKHFQV